jgi:PAS domain S-box-containing protein
MWGGIGCAVVDAILVDVFLTKSQFRFSMGSSPQQLRLSIFLAITILLGYSIRRLAAQRALFHNQQLQQRLSLANAERELAEERARTSEAVRDRDERLQIALRATGMGLWVWDLNQDSLHWSDGMHKLIGQTAEMPPPSNEKWMESVHPDDREAVRRRFMQIQQNGEDYRHDYRVIWPDGSIHWLESQTKGQMDHEGKVVRLVGVISDVTQRKLAEDAMLRAEKLAVVGRLASSVAHEINNPLEAVANLLFLVTIADSLQGAQEHARQAIDEVMRVSLITQQMLKFHRGSAIAKPTLLSELINAVESLLRGKLKAAQVQMETRIASEVPVSCLPGETQQIFANLVSNAIEAMPHGGRLMVRLRASSDWRRPSRSGMRVTFCDTGVGIDRETMRHIFEPFFTTKTETGTGLGMWIVAQLLERQQGHIRGRSSQRAGASGTVFSVFLPLAESPVSDLGTVPDREKAAI